MVAMVTLLLRFPEVRARVMTVPSKLPTLLHQAVVATEVNPADIALVCAARLPVLPALRLQSRDATPPPIKFARALSLSLHTHKQSPARELPRSLSTNRRAF